MTSKKNPMFSRVIANRLFEYVFGQGIYRTRDDIKATDEASNPELMALLEKRMLADGFDVIFDIDWQGTQQLAQAVPQDVVRVFVLPPSLSELESRLMRRAQDSAEVVAARMAKAVDELSHYGEYDHIVINRALDDSVAAARAILNAERTRRERYTGLDAFVNFLTEDRS